MIMKNLYKLLIGVLALSTVTSCDDYLEVDHYDILPADFMFKTEDNRKRRPSRKSKRDFGPCWPEVAFSPNDTALE